MSANKYEHHTLQENIQEGHESANEQASLLKVRQDLLNLAESKLNFENKTFWLEAFGIFIFLYASTCSKQNTGVDLAFFVGIIMAIPIIANQTGANINPAVSLSMTLKNQNASTFPLLWIYVKAQVCGAIVSMIVAIILNDVYRSPLAPVDHTFSQIVRMILSEAVGVFVLIFFVLYVTGPATFIQNNGAKYFYIAVFVYIGRKFAVMSGNQINLALTISQAFVGIPECNYQGFKYILVWFLGDSLGVYIGAYFYNNIIQPVALHLKRRQKAKQDHRKANQSAIELQKIQKV